MTDRKGELLVRAGNGTRQRVIPLNNTARKALKTWLDIRPETALQKSSRRSGERSLPGPFKPSLDTTMVYITPGMSDLDQAVRVLDN